MTEVCEQVYKEMKNRGEAPTFVNARFVKPIDTEALDMLSKAWNIRYERQGTKVWLGEWHTGGTDSD